jgi:SMODS and SLOG-associating 2TM effector domain 3
MVALTKRKKKPSDLRAALNQHLARCPGSPIAAVVESADIQSRLAHFDVADETAVKMQKSHLRVGRAHLWVTMFGTVVGAIALLPIEKAIAGGPRMAIEAFQAIALALGFLGSTICPPSHHWRAARALAEAARADVFRAIVRAGAGARDLLVPALDCFKDAHLEWQLTFFQDRSRQFRRTLFWLTPYRLAAYALRGLVVLFALLVFVNIAPTLGQYWPVFKTLGEWLQAWLQQWFQIKEPGRWQLGFGIMATGLLAFTSARDFMDRSRENVERYRRAAKEVKTLKRVELPNAEAAAAAGNVTDVQAFCENVQSVLSNEHQAWLYGGGTDGGASSD